MAAPILHIGLTPKDSMWQPLFLPLFGLVIHNVGGTPPTPMATGVDMIRSPPFVMGGRLSLRRHALTLLGFFIFMGGSLQALRFSTRVGMSPVIMGGHHIAPRASLMWCTVPVARLMTSRRLCTDLMAHLFTGFHM
jgi:hypothetical protein